MAKKKNSALTDNEKRRIQRHVELSKRARAEGHEHQALKELFEWSKKWEHTHIAQSISNIMQVDTGRQPRGPAFDISGIVQAVVLLEKIGMTTPAAKKLVAERFCTSVRNVELYLKQRGAITRQIINLSLSDDKAVWESMPRFRLTEEEVRKLNEITFREK
jgi:hypothetical protein